MERRDHISLLGLAVSRDLISPEAVAQVAMGLPEGSGLLEAVLAQGLLEAEDVELLSSLVEAHGPDSGPRTSLGEPLRAEDPPTQAFTTHPPVRPSQPSALGRSVLDVWQLTTWQHYRHLEFLGEGGMGRIFKAFDPVLKREVALKFLARDEPDKILRFILEAQHQAKVDHPNICKVFEVGEWKGQSYIAMQLIRGRTLSEARGDLTLEEKVGVMQVVAEAIHAAHRQGLIHRDLKPGNIMVSRDGGVLKPYILDFGLARGLEATGLTQQGVAVGTLGYMAPEQAQGLDGAVGFPADIYGMGATLYMLLAGDPPFVDSSGLELLRRTVEEEPRPMSTLGLDLPKDLDTIVMKCLEKEPGRRYASALALAEDLRRFLAGEPLLAVPLDWRDALRKKLRRNKTLSIVVGVAAVALLALGSLALRSEWHAHRQAALAQRFGTESERLVGSYRWAQTLPLHDMRPHKGELRAWMGRLQDQMTRLGSVAKGPGNFAMGRGCLALGEAGKALGYLEEAWKAGSHDPETAELLGLAHGAVLRDGLEDANRLATQSLKEARLAELNRLHTQPALFYLRQSGTDPSRVQEGRIALLEARFDDALAIARKALDRDPWLVEANLLVAQAQLARARKAIDLGDHAGAASDTAEALSAAGRAQAMARSLVDAYALEGDAHRLEMELAEARGQSVEGPAQAYRAALERALTADPESAEVHVKMARLYRLWANTEANDGKDPEAHLEMAIHHCVEAIHFSPGHPVATLYLSNIYNLQADYRASHGQDPLPVLEACLAYGRAAIDLRPQDPYPYNNLGMGLLSKGEYLLKHGRDPKAALREALGALETSCRLDGAFYYPWVNRGIALRRLAQQQEREGGDPLPLMEQAQTCYREALKINPKRVPSLNNLGTLCLFKAEMELRRGADARASLEEAATVLDRGLAINPKHANLHSALGDLATVQGLRLRLSGGDPMPSYREALVRYRRALALNGNDADTYQKIGRVWREQGQALAAQGLPSAGAFEQARKALVQSLRIDGRDVERLGDLTRVLLQRAMLAEAAATADQARALVPDASGPLLLKAEVELGMAWAGPRDARERRLAQAEAGLDAAAVLEPWNPLRDILRAQVLLLRAGMGAQGHRQALEALTLLKTAFREDRLLALSYHPWLARATQAKGQVQRNL